MMNNKHNRILFFALLLIATGHSANVFGLERLVTHWAAGFIKPLIESRVINGYPDDTIRLDQHITRAELCHVLKLTTENICRRRAETANASTRFSATKDAEEISANHWAHNSISISYRNGLLSEKNSAFKPDAYLTREEAGSILARCVTYLTGLENRNEKPSGYFTDQSAISAHASSDVEWLHELGIVHGYPDRSFKPREYLLRSEAFTMVSLLESYVSGLPYANPTEQPARSIGQAESPVDDIFSNGFDTGFDERFLVTQQSETEDNSVRFIAPTISFSAQMGSSFRTIDVDIKITAPASENTSVYYMALENGSSAPTAKEIIDTCNSEETDNQVIKGQWVTSASTGSDGKSSVRLTLAGGEGTESAARFIDGYNYQLYMTAVDSKGNISAVASSPPIMAMPFHARSADNKTFTIKEISTDEINKKYPDLKSSSPMNKSKCDRTAIQLENISRLAKLYQETNGVHGDSRFLTSHEYTYVLTGDMDLKPYNSGRGWISIGGMTGETDYSFGGSFDGQNYRIYGLYINSHGEDQNAVGLFGKSSGASIRNLELVNPIINATDNGEKNEAASYINAGSLVGCAEKCIIENIVISSPVLTAYSSGTDRCYTGGLVGSAKNTDISYSYVNNALIRSGDGLSDLSQATGGIVGRYSYDKGAIALFNNLTVSGVIDSHGWTTGGAAGIIDVTSKSPVRLQCGDIDVSAALDGAAYAGGIVGIVGNENAISSDSMVIFENCTASGSVNSGKTSGGLFGKINAVDRNVVVKRSQAVNTVTADSHGIIGGFAGEVISASIESCSSDGAAIAGEDISPVNALLFGGIGGFAGVAKGEADFIDCLSKRDVRGVANTGGFIGASWGNVYFQSCSAEDAIVSAAGDNAGGFAGLQKNGSAKFYNCSAGGQVTGAAHVGGFAGSVGTGGGKTEFLRSTSSGDVTGTGSSGGFIGKLENESELRLCSSTGKVIGSSAGGFIGELSGRAADEASERTVLVVKCHSKGDVYAPEYTAGGFIADIKHAYIDQCFSTGNVKKSGSGQGSGGFCGRIGNGGLIYNSYALGDILANGVANGSFAGLIMDNANISFCYGNGNVSGLAYTGGFVGRLQDDAPGSSIIGCVSLSEQIANTVDDRNTNRFAGAVGTALLGNCYAKENAVVHMSGNEIKLITPDINGPDGEDLRTAEFRAALENIGWDKLKWDLDTITGENGKVFLGRPTLLDNRY